jgi:hypothetical protein
LKLINSFKYKYLKSFPCEVKSLEEKLKKLENKINGQLKLLRRKIFSQPRAKTSGVVYIRWGRKRCPKTSKLVYTGKLLGNCCSNYIKIVKV